MPEYKLNDTKAVEVILYLCKKQGADIYKIMKAIYNAEIYHLNKYFRPVLGDTIKALDHGPVPFKTYNIANGKVSSTETPFYRVGNEIKSKREPNLDEISKSDIKALEYGWEMVKDEDFKDIRNITHDDLYYQVRERDDQNYTYLDLLLPENKKKAEEIFRFSEFIVF